MVDIPAPDVGRVPLEGEARRSRFEALGSPQYRVLFVSSTLMFFAIQAQQIAAWWLAIELTGDNAGLGGVFMAFGVPMLILAPAGGVIADRFPKKAVLTVCQSVILLAGVDGRVRRRVRGARVLDASGGVGRARSRPLRDGPGPHGVHRRGRDRDSLPNAVVLQQMGMNGTRVIGPAVAGVLIGIPSIGAGGVFIVTSAIIVVAIWFTFHLPNVPVRGNAGAGSPFSQLVDGLRYVRSRPQVMLLIAAFSVVVIVGFPYLAFLPFVVEDIFDVGSSGYGVMSAVSAAAAVVATFWLAGRVHRGSVWRLQAMCGIAFGVGLVLLAVAPTTRSRWSFSSSSAGRHRGSRRRTARSSSRRPRSSTTDECSHC